MKLYPAIDLLDGGVVRLTQGDYDQKTCYNRDPEALARAFYESGARCLHVVDLNAALDGSPANLKSIAGIRRVKGLFVEVGGGARDEQSVRRYLDLGIDRVIVGSAALTDPEFFRATACAHPGQIAAGVDAKDGKIAIHGWKTITDTDAFSFMAALPALGVHTVIFTDIARDGMLGGSNVEACARAAAIPNLNVIASGGISSADELRALKKAGLYGAIVGKALLDGRLSIPEALEAAEGAMQC